MRALPADLSCLFGRVKGSATAALTLALLLSACSTPGPVFDMRGRSAAEPTKTPETAAVKPTAAAPVDLKLADRRPADQGAAPYNAAVAARFSDPKVTYRTPAFAANRAGFTSNAELQALTTALVQDAVPATGQPRVSLLPLGTSQKGVPLQALLFTREFDLSPRRWPHQTGPRCCWWRSNTAMNLRAAKR